MVRLNQRYCRAAAALEGCAPLQCNPCSSLQSLSGAGGRKPPPEQIPSKQTPQDFMPGPQVTPWMCSPDTRGLALGTGIPDKGGQAVPIPSAEDEEEQAANNRIQFHLGKQPAPNHRGFDL